MAANRLPNARCVSDGLVRIASVGAIPLIVDCGGDRRYFVDDDAESVRREALRECFEGGETCEVKAATAIERQSFDRSRFISALVAMRLNSSTCSRSLKKRLERSS